MEARPTFKSCAIARTDWPRILRSTRSNLGIFGLLTFAQKSGCCCRAFPVRALVRIRSRRACRSTRLPPLPRRAFHANCCDETPGCPNRFSIGGRWPAAFLMSANFALRAFAASGKLFGISHFRLYSPVFMWCSRGRCGGRYFTKSPHSRHATTSAPRISRVSAGFGRHCSSSSGVKVSALRCSR